MYPHDWPDIARKIKEKAGWKCERCQTPHTIGSPEPGSGGAMLTTHHLDGNPANCEEWNLAALCQRCHLSIQARVNLFQAFMLEHEAWMKPHVEGMMKALQERRWP